MSQATIARETGYDESVVQQQLYLMRDVFQILEIENRPPIDGRWQTNIYRLSPFLFEEKTLEFLNSFFAVFQGILDFYRLARQLLNIKKILTENQVQYYFKYFLKRASLLQTNKGKAEVASEGGGSPTKVSFCNKRPVYNNATKESKFRNYVNTFSEGMFYAKKSISDPLVEDKPSRLTLEFWLAL